MKLLKILLIGGTATITFSLVRIAGYLGASTILIYLDIPNTALQILSFLMLIDFIFGVMRQYFIDKSQLESHEAWRGIFKKVSTLGLILSIGLMFKGIELDGKNYIEGILGLFIMSEAYSIVRNVYGIRTGKMIPEYDVISIIIKKLGDFIINLIDNKKQ